MKTLIVLLLIISTPAFADGAITVHKGDVVSPAYDGGSLLNKEKAKKLENQLIDGDACAKENDSYQKSVNLYKSNEIIYNQENSLLLGRNVDLSKALNDAKSTSDLTKILYFTLGIAITGLGIYGAKAALK
jgi:hypothetical protein